MRTALTRQPGRAVAAAVALGVLLVILVLQLEWSVRGIDAHVLFQQAARISDLDEPFYIAGAEQKGPFWLGLYVLAYEVGGYYNAWWLVGLMASVVAVVTGLGVWRIALARGGSSLAAGVVAGVGALYLLVGSEEFSGLLYSRNIVVALEVVAVVAILAASRRAGGRRRGLLVLAGAALGLAVQTNQGSAASGLAVTALALVVLPAGRGLRSCAGELVLLAAAGLLTLASAPAWYAATGNFDEFWDQWWTYNTYYRDATDVSTPGMLRNGVDSFWAYYQGHPFYVLTLLAFAADTWRRRKGGIPAGLDVWLLGWWLAACLDVALSQRFFGHYFVVPFVPVTLMAATLAARHAPALAPPHLHRGAAAFAVLAVFFTCMTRLDAGWEHLKEVRSTSDMVARHVADQNPSEQALRTAVAERSPRLSYVWFWVTDAGRYTKIERRSATRYVEKRWLIGQIYGGTRDEDPDYILPGTQEKWTADMRRTPPTLIIEEKADRIPRDTPYGRFVDCFEQDWEDVSFIVHVPKTDRPVTECLPPAEPAAPQP